MGLFFQLVMSPLMNIPLFGYVHNYNFHALEEGAALLNSSDFEIVCLHCSPPGHSECRRRVTRTLQKQHTSIATKAQPTSRLGSAARERDAHALPPRSIAMASTPSRG